MKKVFLLLIIFSLFSLASSEVFAAALEITTENLPDGTFGVAYAQQIQARGGTLPYTFSRKSGTLPPGLCLSSDGINCSKSDQVTVTGAAVKIIGTPTKDGVGSHDFSIRVVDSAAQPQVDDQDLSIFIEVPQLKITNPTGDTITPGTLGEYYEFTFKAEGGIPDYTWTNPSEYLKQYLGLQLSLGGKISGTPLKAGSFSTYIIAKGDPIVVSSENQAGDYFNFTIESVPFEITTANLSSGQSKTPYTAILSAHGGTPPYSWSIAIGSLPPGLDPISTNNFFQGVIRGTPTTEGTFPFTVLVKDAKETELAKPFSILIEKSCQCSDGTSCGACKAGSPPLYCDGNTKTLINNAVCQGGTTPGQGTPTGGISSSGEIPKGKLEVSWPNSPMGTPLNDDSKLVDLIKYLYEWGISLGGFAAFIALIVAGVQYLTSVGNAGRMSDAMSRIRSAGIGLVLLFGSFLILNTINPQLTELKMPTMTPGEKAEELKSISVETKAEKTECKGATIWTGTYYNGGTPEEISLGENPFSPKKNIGSVQAKGSCQITLFKISGSCSAINDANPSVTVLGDTPIVESGTTQFSCAVVNHSSFMIPTPATTP